jgi:hydrogenase expression/formation protein HypE
VNSRSLPIGKLSGGLLGELLATLSIDDPAVIVGPGVGMDAAAVDVGGDLLVVKSDPITFARDRAPHYLVNINANDLACLGATPRWLLVTALFPAGTTTEGHIRALFTELQSACSRRGITLIGGHTEITEGIDRVLLVGQMLGTAHPTRLLAPGAAKPGDRILLSRPAAIEGTALLAIELRERLAASVDNTLLDRAARFLDDPGISIVEDAKVLLRTGLVSALHDPTEGGVATGVRELASAAKAGALVSRAAIPLFPETRAIADALEIDPLGLLASGSLLATVPAAGMADVERACREAAMPFAWIGKIVPTESGMILREERGEVELPAFSTDEAARVLAAATT